MGSSSPSPPSTAVTITISSGTSSHPPTHPLGKTGTTGACTAWITKLSLLEINRSDVIIRTRAKLLEYKREKCTINQWKKEQTNRCCTTDVCLRQSVNKLYNNQKWHFQFLVNHRNRIFWFRPNTNLRWLEITEYSAGTEYSVIVYFSWIFSNFTEHSANLLKLWPYIR